LELGKQEAVGTEEYGDSAPQDHHVCPDCVADGFLKTLLSQNLVSRTCNYCGRHADTPIAAPVSVLLDSLAGALGYSFCDPLSGGVPCNEGDFVLRPLSTEEALDEIGFSCSDHLREDVLEAFGDRGWVPAHEEGWLSSSPSRSWGHAWQRFVHTVKHEVRFFFSTLVVDQDQPEGFVPAELLATIGRLACELGLVRELPVGSRLFRVRNREDGDNWKLCAEELGVPPSEKVRARRMNPSGIGYLYLAHERETALAEVLGRPPCQAGLGCFEVAFPLRVLDLGRLPEVPSVFDVDHRLEREVILFLEEFVAEVCRPVARDRQEHVDYVPSQVVSEYFAKVFRTPKGEGVDGIAYPSTVRKGGMNVVLFPPPGGRGGFERLVSFVKAENVDFADWRSLFQAIGVVS